MMMQKKSILCFTLLFFSLFISHAFADYYDYDFVTEDDIEDAYLDGAYNEVEYRDAQRDYRTQYEADDTDDDDDSTGTRTLTMTSRSNTYKAFDKETAETLRFTWDDFRRNYDAGVCAGVRTQLCDAQYDTAQQAVYGTVAKRGELDKWYVGYHRNNTQYMLGNYAARFGTGLTFSKGMYQGTGLRYDTEAPYSYTYRFYTQADKSAYEYKTLFFERTYLRGAAGTVSSSSEHATFTGLYSDADCTLDSVPVEHFNTGVHSTMKLDKGYNERIAAGAAVFDVASFGMHDTLRTGIVYHASQKTYPWWSPKEDARYHVLGLWSQMNYGGVVLDGEASSSDEAVAFLCSATVNTEHQTVLFSVRDYPRQYTNPFAYALCLRPSKNYFPCQDEQGVRFATTWKYPVNDTTTDVTCSIMGDMYSYSGTASWDSTQERMVVRYGEKVTTVRARAQYAYRKKKGMTNTITYTMLRRNSGDISSKKTADYTDVVFQKMVWGMTIRAMLGARYNAAGTAKGYYGDSLSLLCKKTYRRASVSLRVKFRDYQIDRSDDERYTYFVTIAHKAAKGLQLRYGVIIVDNSHAGLIESDVSRVFSYTWNAGVEYVF